mgnify:CR=1 FL=1
MGIVLRRNIALRLIAGLIMAAGLSGCGLTVPQKAALDHFASATHDFSTIAQTEFQKSRQDVIEMNRYRFELGDQFARGASGQSVFRDFRHPPIQDR